MRQVVAFPQDAAVNARVKGFDAAVHDFRKAGMRFYTGHGNAGIFQLFGRAARGDDLNTVFPEIFRKRCQPRFVCHGNQGTLYRYGHRIADC